MCRNSRNRLSTYAMKHLRRTKATTTLWRKSEILQDCGLPESIIKRYWHDMLQVISNLLPQTGTGCSVIIRQPPLNGRVDSLFPETCYEI